MEEDKGECSASASAAAKPSDEIWAKLVPSDSRYSDVEIRSEEKVICSQISATVSDKHSWCKIVRNSDLCSATMENKSPNTILVDGAVVCNDETIAIKDGSEIISGSDKEGFVSYRFHIMSSPETCQRQLKICVDVENAKCSICLNIWHDVVTTGPCLHNFCNGCFSEWLRRSQEKCSTVLCPQCRAVVQFVRRNPFLRTIAEDMVRADSSLRRSDEEIALLDSHASVRSDLAEGVPGAGAGPVRTYSVEFDSEEEEESDSGDQDDEEEEEEEEEETDSVDQGDEEEADSSLSHSDEEVALLDTHASVRSNLHAEPPAWAGELFGRTLLRLDDLQHNMGLLRSHGGYSDLSFRGPLPFNDLERRLMELSMNTIRQSSDAGASGGCSDLSFRRPLPFNDLERRLMELSMNTIGQSSDAGASGGGAYEGYDDPME